MKKSLAFDADHVSEEDAENLLSYKVSCLDMHPIQTKFFSHFEETHSTINSCTKGDNCHQKPIKNYSNTEKIKNNQTRKQSYSTKKKCGSINLQITKQEGYRLDDARIFEIGEARNGRKPALTEIKNAKLSVFSGKALAVFPNNKKYQGQWVDGNLIGQVKISYPNGNIYVGSTYNFLRHGKGYLYFGTGEKYIGEFGSGDFHGSGTLYNKKGEIIYEGEWRRGRKLQR